jgi:ABC-type multidrug transport system fused ATPase/permease subunit
MDLPLGRYWHLLRTYLRPHWRLVLLVALLLGGSLGLQLAAPQILRAFIDSARAGQPLDHLAAIALLFIALAAGQEVVGVLLTYAGQSLGWAAGNALRRDLALHALTLDMSFHNRHTPGEMIERIDQDVTEMANFFSQLVINVVGNLLLLLGVLVAFYLETTLLGIAFTLLALLGLATLYRTRALAAPHWAAGRQTSTELTGFVEERFAGTEDIRSSGATEYKMHLLYGIMRRMMARYRDARVTGHWAFFSVRMAVNLGLVVGLAIGASLYLQGRMTLGTVYLISAYAGTLGWPLEALTDQVQEFQRVGASIKRVYDLSSVPRMVQDGPGVPFPPGALAAEFRDVTFGYDPAAPVLQDIAFRVEPGQVLGLLGRTGSGKTTISRLLFRLYDPQAGAVLLGDQDLREARLADLRARVGMVTQDVQLFAASVRDNLSFFNPAIADARILQAIADLGLSDWFARLPAGLDTQLVAGGGGLSAGEAQLLAFVRVFLKDPGLVILDEASSRLDPGTERLIESGIARLLAGRSAIIIAHRLGTVQRADRILILEGGQIREQGERAALARDPASRFAGLLRTGLEEVLT